MNIPPTGPIADSLILESELAKQYFDFLTEHDPLTDWKDIVPLSQPIITETTYDYDLDAVSYWASICPQLVGAAKYQNLFDEIAPRVGYRYAWSRVQMHCQLLTALERWYDDKELPTTIIEPGCFCSGLIHFLPTVWDATYFGIDISPVALDVCRSLERSDQLPGKRKLLRADFQVIGKTQLSEHMDGDFSDSLILIANVLGTIQSSWELFPSVDASAVTAWLVSHWVNQGATVVVCERNRNPAEHIQYIRKNGRWDSYVETTLLDDFDAIATSGMDSEAPLGSWEKKRTGISVYQRTQ